jgi:hypothetical protein
MLQPVQYGQLPLLSHGILFQMQNGMLLKSIARMEHGCPEDKFLLLNAIQDAAMYGMAFQKVQRTGGVFTQVQV